MYTAYIYAVYIYAAFSVQGERTVCAAHGQLWFYNYILVQEGRRGGLGKRGSLPIERNIPWRGGKYLCVVKLVAPQQGEAARSEPFREWERIERCVVTESWRQLFFPFPPLLVEGINMRGRW